MSANLSDEEIVTLWKDSSFTGSFQSARVFQQTLYLDKKIFIPLKRIYSVLSKIPEYLVLIRPIRHFDRRNYATEIHGFFNLVQADIAIMFPFRGYKYFLLVIDVFSHRIFAKILKRKTALETKNALSEIFKEFQLPSELESDKGKEFTSPLVQNFLKEKGVYWHGKTNEKKASFAEWGIYKVKKILYQEMYAKETRNWPSLFFNTVAKINNTPNPSLNMLKPSQFSSSLDDYLINKNLHSFITWKQKRRNAISYEQSPHSFQIGEEVILDQKKKNFEKSYKPRVGLFDKILSYPNVYFSLAEKPNFQSQGHFSRSKSTTFQARNSPREN